MKLETLLRVLPESAGLTGIPDIDVSDVVYDPLRVTPASLFVAINIYTQLDKIEIPDGHDRVDQAVANGAVAVILQKDVDVPNSVFKLVVPDSRLALARLANKFYDYPSRRMKLIGVTGTNGKTTTTHIIESIFLKNYRTGLIGTLYYKINGAVHQSKDTTPEPTDLQAIFKRMVGEQIDYCVFEVSSHGIDFHRVEGCEFDVAVFTNLSQDHLDYHHTMEHYRKTKMRLFEGLALDRFAVINRDDPSAQFFVDASKAKVLTYGTEGNVDIAALDVNLSISGTEYTLQTPAGKIQVRSRLLGLFNVYNSLAAAGVAHSQSIDLETIKQGLEEQIRVAGRFELVDRGQAFSVVVDYAHTPDGLSNALRLARSVKPQRIITVFGCGGDRDKEKRPIMGEVASKFSDEIIITADNPRNEDPHQIAREIAGGIRGVPFDTIIDRHEAIEHAIRNARAGDIVMICGKGHESTQTLKDRTIPFNDAEVAAELLEATQ